MPILKEKQEYDKILAYYKDPKHPEVVKAKEKLDMARLDLASGTSTVASTAAELIEPERTNGTMNVQQATTKGATETGAKFAAAGSAFGPWGTVIGGAVGGVVGGVTSNIKAKEINSKIKARNNRIIGTRNAAITEKEENEFNANTPQYMKKGGKVKRNSKLIPDDNGGFVIGEPGVDKNNVDVNKDSYVIPATNDPNLKKVVKTVAKTAGLDKKVKTNSKNNTNVRLSNGELVIPPDKAKELEEQGIDLEGLKNTINTEKGVNDSKKTTTMQKGKGYDTGFTPTQRKLNLMTQDEIKQEQKRQEYAKILGVSPDLVIHDGKGRFSLNNGISLNGLKKSGKRYPTIMEKYQQDQQDKIDLGIGRKNTQSNSSTGRLSTPLTISSGSGDSGDDNGDDDNKSEVNKIFKNEKRKRDRIIAGVQGMVGAVSSINAENKVRKSLNREQQIIDQAKNEEDAENFASARSKEAAVERGFRDTRDSIMKLKEGSLRDLAKNSLTPQEVNANYGKVTGILADKLADANSTKTSAILGIKANELGQKKDIIRSAKQDSLNHQAKETEYNVAKLSRADLLLKTGTENFMKTINTEKSEIKRRRMMQEIIDLYKAQGKELDDEAILQYKDLLNIS